MSLLELLQKDYIRSPYHWKEMWINASKRDSDWDWLPIDKVRIKKIKIDKKFLPNEVNDDEVTYMINNFDEEVWHAVMINEDYFLLDGQHRLRLAFRTGMKYIDVIMEKRKDPDLYRVFINLFMVPAKITYGSFYRDGEENLDDVDYYEAEISLHGLTLAMVFLQRVRQSLHNLINKNFATVKEWRAGRLAADEIARELQGRMIALAKYLKKESNSK